MQYRVATFITCIGQKALEVHNNLPFKSDEDKNNMDMILKEWEEYCCGKTNVIYERFCFNRANQAESDIFDQYLLRLRKLASTCEYGPMADDLIRDRIVCGISSDDIRKELLNENKLTLESCVTMVKSAEITAKQAKTMSHTGTTDPAAVNYVNKMNKQQGTKKKKKPCKFCGQLHIWGKEYCPAYDRTCQSCGRKGHSESKCGDFQNQPQSTYKSKSKSRKSGNSRYKSSRHKNTRALDAESDLDSESNSETYSESEEECSLIDLFESEPLENKSSQSSTNSNANTNEKVHNVNTSKVKSSTIVAMMYVNKTPEPVAMQIDCGASCNVLPAQYLPAGVVLTETNKKLRMYSDHLVPVLGTCKLHLKNPKNDRRYLVPFYVIDSERNSLQNKFPLLGSSTAQQMQLISVNHENIAIVDELHETVANVSSKDTKESLCQEYRYVFHGRGCMPGKVKLHVDENVKPHVAPPRRVPLSVQPRLKAELERLEKEGVIKKVEEPTDWCSSLVCDENLTVNCACALIHNLSTVL